MRILEVALLLLIASCSIAPVQQDIPPQVVSWSEQNVWKVDATFSKGSGFWINDTTLVTNCHVLRSSINVSVQNHDKSKRLGMMVTACDVDADLALLELKEPAPEFTPDLTYISKKIPKRGTAIYGPGYPLGRFLFITKGHWQSKAPRGYAISAPIIMGDSGSPAVYLKKNRVIVAGVRSAMAYIPQRMSKFFVTHIALVRDTEQMITFLDRNKVKYNVK